MTPCATELARRHPRHGVCFMCCGSRGRVRLLGVCPGRRYRPCWPMGQLPSRTPNRASSPSRCSCSNMGPTALFFGAGLDGHYRQRRPDLPGLADHGPVGPGENHADGGRRGRGRPDGDRQCAEPGGRALLRRGFNDESIGALGLLLGAAAPTDVAAALFLV